MMIWIRPWSQLVYLMFYAVIPCQGHDGTGCPRNWQQFRGFCYSDTKYSMAYEKGRHFCDYLLDSSLVEVKDLDENRFLSNLTSRKSWLGFRRCHNQRFFWTDSEPANFTSWDTDSGQPDNKDTNEQCVFVSATGNWSDGICLERKAFVCQRIDTKCTNITKCYVVKPSLVKWDEARSRCQAEGLRLAKISNSEENKAVSSLLTAAKDAWIGLERKNRFCTENSLESKFQNWDFHEPNDQGLAENCVAIGVHGKWSDEKCDASLSVICKRDIEECIDPEAHGCDENAVCTNTVGSFRCDSCKDGYSRDGTKCTRKNVPLIVLGSLFGLCCFVIFGLILYIVMKKRRWL